jgi:hypothetical protein
MGARNLVGLLDKAPSFEKSFVSNNYYTKCKQIKQYKL